MQYGMKVKLFATDDLTMQMFIASYSLEVSRRRHNIMLGTAKQNSGEKIQFRQGVLTP